MSGSIAELVAERSVLVTCGPGGVGKTTVAAALGIAAARAGRRVVVLTVDPARRLADALGLSDVGNEPVTISPSGRAWPGHLDAVMLDAAATFDDLVRAQSTSPGQADTILRNPLYRNISSALSGTHEYMAIEKLHALATSGDYDLVVVDTPPSRNALDLLDAPRRIVRFIDHPLYRLFTAPSRSLVRAFGVAARTFLWTVKRVAGGAVVDDAVEFLRAFEGMDEGFRRRAADTETLLRNDDTAFVVVSSPRAEALDEAWVLGEALGDTGLGVDGIVVNQLHPTPPNLDADIGDRSEMWGLAAAHRAMEQLAASERAESDLVVSKFGPIPTARVPRLDDDIADVDGLSELAELLTADSVE